MSSPAAVAPVAVLVLAWDETTPAVRALVEATEVVAPVIDSVVVVVPAAAGALEELTQEEFLPLANVPALTDELLLETSSKREPPATEAVTLTKSAAKTTPTSKPVTEDSIATPVTLLSVPLVAVGAAAASATSISPTPLASVEAPASLAASSLEWTAVRVLSLSDYSLPDLAARAGQQLPMPIWTGASALPAAPYVGSSEADSTAITSFDNNQNQTPSEPLAVSSSSSTTDFRTVTDADQLVATASSPALPPTYPSIEPISLGADLEESENSVSVAEDLEIELAQELSSEEELATEAENQGQEADEIPSVDFAPEQANWHEALASLRQPATTEPAPLALLDAPSGDEQTEPFMHPALRPTAGTFEAPNLNFQVIQYARFAVPVALAEQPFEVIYAPTWPTWLAAQELRQRVGKPLVLHVDTLAAADDESVDTATGWVAELQRQVLRRADLILTETPALAYRLRDELNLPATAVRAVPAADAKAIAHALQTAHVRPTASAS